LADTFHKANDITTHTQECTGEVRLTAGHYIEVFAYQNAGGGLDIIPGQSSFSLAWIRP